MIVAYPLGNISYWSILHLKIRNGEVLFCGRSEGVTNLLWIQKEIDFCAERHCFLIYTYISLHWMYFILIKVENCTNKREIFLDGRTENYFERQFKQNDGPHASVILRVLICFTCSLYLWPKFVNAYIALRNHCRQYTEWVKKCYFLFMGYLL